MYQNTERDAKTKQDFTRHGGGKGVVSVLHEEWVYSACEGILATGGNM